MEASAFVTVLRDRLSSDGGDTPQSLLHSPNVNRLTAESFEHRRGEELANLQYEVAELRRELHGELQKLSAQIRLDLAERSADSMKWAMLFWVGQAVAVAGIVSALR
jgi:hypothetical protein